MKKIIIAFIISLAVLVTVASAFALIAGPFTKEEAIAASKDPHFYNELGYKLAQENNNAAAQKAFEKAVSLDPDYERARSNLATIAFNNKDYATAIEQLRVLTSWHPENKNYEFDLAQNLVSQARYVDADVSKLQEAAGILESLGDYPHAAENAAIVRQVLANNAG